MKNMKKLLVAILIIGLSFGIYTYKVNDVSASCGAGFSYCRSITLTAAQIPANQTNFTVLVCANATQGNGNACPTVAGLNQSGAGNHVTNANGYDITFWTSSNCTGAMNWETEKYVASTGEIEAWVLITSLSTSGNTFYMCYSKSSISTFQGGSVGSAWDANYKGVWHLSTPTSTALDSTSNGNTGTPTSITAGAGQTDGGATVGNTSTILASSTTVSTGFTYEFWSSSNNAPNSSNVQQIMSPAKDNDSTGFDWNQTNPAFEQSCYYQTSGGSYTSAKLTSTLSANTWYLISCVWDGATGAAFLNGSSQASNGVASIKAFAGNLVMGGFGDGAPWAGILDEVRFSTSARSGNWLTTEYNNESAPNSFETFGTEIQAVVPNVHAVIMAHTTINAHTVITGRY